MQNFAVYGAAALLLGSQMSSINKVILVGNLGADPETRYLSNGDAVCNLRVATTEKWKDKGSRATKESTEWHRVVLFRRLAEIASQYLKKGDSLYLEGRLRTRKWKDRDGLDRYTTEIEATSLQMLGGAKGGDSKPSKTLADMPPELACDSAFSDIPF